MKKTSRDDDLRGALNFFLKDYESLRGIIDEIFLSFFFFFSKTTI